MREELKMKISQFVDGELAADEAVKLLKSMREEPELGEVFRRYEAVSQALKTDIFVAADAGFIERVSAQIKHEPVVFCPSRHSSRRHLKTTAAIAASVTAVAMIVAGTVYFRSKQLAGGMELAQRQAVEPMYADSQPAQEDDTRFNEYLEAHGATLYAGGNASSQMYGRVVSYGRK
jgi:sigma-E factor negative regulatory protein RseA